jgi:putative phosphoesterase
MRYGIISDIHSNLQAFQAVLDYYKTQSIDKFIFLGDIVGYGANPRQCIKLLQSLNAVTIAGNHDWAVTDLLDIKYFNEYAEKAILWTKNELSMDDIGYLKSFALTYQESNFICVHGSLQNPERFNYILGLNDAFNNFSLFKKSIMFVGHSHRLEAYSCGNNEVFYVAERRFRLKPQVRYIVNAGSIGQPRDRDPRASICIYDSEENMVFFERLEYNIKAAADEILTCGLPTILAQRLYAGW